MSNMTTEEKRRYLKRYKALSQNVNALCDELTMERIKSSSTGSLEYDDIPKSKSGKYDTSDIMIKLEEIQEHIHEALKEKYAKLHEISTIIEGVSDEKYSCVLRYRYIMFYTWEKISDIMEVSEDTAKRWGREALENLKIPFNNT